MCTEERHGVRQQLEPVVVSALGKCYNNIQVTYFVDLSLPIRTRVVTRLY